MADCGSLATSVFCTPSQQLNWMWELAILCFDYLRTVLCQERCENLLYANCSILCFSGLCFGAGILCRVRGSQGRNQKKIISFFSWCVLISWKKIWSEKNQDWLTTSLFLNSLHKLRKLLLTGLFSRKTSVKQITMKSIRKNWILYSSIPVSLWLTFFDMYYANKILTGFTTFNRSKVASLASELWKWIMARWNCTCQYIVPVDMFRKIQDNTV